MRFIMIILYYILKYFIVQIFIHLHTRPEELTVSRFFAKYKKIKIEKKIQKRKRIPRNICATFAEIHLHFKRIAIKLYLLKLN